MPIGGPAGKEFIDLDKPSAFKKSGLTQRSPPAISKMSTTSKPPSVRQQMNANYYTKSKTIACNSCEILDDHSKLKCRKCGEWWHTGCQKSRPLYTAQINVGRWICLAYLKEDSAASKPPIDDTDVTRTEVSHIIAGLPNLEPGLSSTTRTVQDQPDESTMIKPKEGFKEKEDVSVKKMSRASSLKSQQSQTVKSRKSSVIRLDEDEVTNQLLFEKLAIIEKQK